MCVCIWEGGRERERESLYSYVCLGERESVCMCVSLGGSERESLYSYVCLGEKERESVSMCVYLCVLLWGRKRGEGERECVCVCVCWGQG